MPMKFEPLSSTITLINEGLRFALDSERENVNRLLRWISCVMCRAWAKFLKKRDRNDASEQNGFSNILSYRINIVVVVVVVVGLCALFGNDKLYKSHKLSKILFFFFFFFWLCFVCVGERQQLSCIWIKHTKQCVEAQQR